MRCSNPDNRWTRPSTTSSYPTLLDLAVRVSPVMGCMIDSPAMATKIWSQPRNDWLRSEEHTSELQSHLNLVCRLLLEKKKKKTKQIKSSFSITKMIAITIT